MAHGRRRGPVADFALGPELKLHLIPKPPYAFKYSGVLRKHFLINEMGIILIRTNDKKTYSRRHFAFIIHAAHLIGM